MGLIHTCIRVRDIDASIAFYKQLGFEVRGRLNFDAAYNVYLGLPGDGDRLELTVNPGHDEPYEFGDGYNHVAINSVRARLETRRARQGGNRARQPALQGSWKADLDCVCSRAG